MPVHVNKIGAYTFIDIRGPFDLRQEQIELFARPGFDGVIARKTGNRGKPFTITTISYATDFVAAQTAINTFHANLVGADPVEIIRFSQNEGTFLILSVNESEPPKAIVNSTAGNFGVRMVHEWQVVEQ